MAANIVFCETAVSCVFKHPTNTGINVNASCALQEPFRLLMVAGMGQRGLK